MTGDHRQRGEVDLEDETLARAREHVVGIGDGAGTNIIGIPLRVVAEAVGRGEGDVGDVALNLPVARRVAHGSGAEVGRFDAPEAQVVASARHYARVVGGRDTDPVDL